MSPDGVRDVEPLAMVSHETSMYIKHGMAALAVEEYLDELEVMGPNRL